MINAILIDDEKRALDGLSLKLKKHFPTVNILAEYMNPKEAVDGINQLLPDLVFIDITMPQMSGFDVLAAIDDPSFEVIFVTAYSDYAIEAIRHAAIGYLVKPLDEDELVDVVNQAVINIKSKQSIDKNMLLLSHLLTQNQSGRIAIPMQKGIRFLNVKDIIRFSGMDGYTQICCVDNAPMLSSYSIGKFAGMVKNQGFFSCHKSHLINLKYVVGILNNGMLEMVDGEIPYSKVKKKELLELMQVGLDDS